MHLNRRLFFYQYWFSQRSLRERLLAFLLLLLLPWLLVLIILDFRNQWPGPSIETNSERRAELKLQQEQQHSLALRIGDDRYLRQSRHLQHLSEELQQVEQQIRIQSQKLNQPSGLSSVLEQLTSNPDVRLLQFNKLPLELADPMFQSSSQGMPVLYRHRVQLELQANFTHLVAFIHQLEQLDESLNWQSLALIRLESGQLQARLELFGLSPNPRWLDA